MDVNPRIWDTKVPLPGHRSNGVVGLVDFYMCYNFQIELRGIISQAAEIPVMYWSPFKLCTMFYFTFYFYSNVSN